jgi:hypothetical protein
MALVEGWRYYWQLLLSVQAGFGIVSPSNRKFEYTLPF